MERNPALLRLLRVVVEEGNWSALADADIRASQFFGEAEVVYGFIQAYHKDYQAFPNFGTVEQQTGIKLPDLADRKFVIEEARKWVLGNTIRAHIEEAIRSLQRGNPYEALSHLEIAAPQASKVESFRKDWETRLAEYRSRKLRGIVGVPIPWPSLEAIFHRWENSTLTAILGLANAGKSWLACVSAVHAMNCGKTVLLVSMENSRNSFRNRLDSLVYKIPFTDVRQGTIDSRQETRWVDQLVRDEPSKGDILLADSNEVQQVSDALALVQSYRPHIVIIDGAYRLSDRQSEGGWGETKQVINDLQSAASRTKIPWLCTSQLNPSKKKTLSGYDMGFDARYGKEWMINPDNVIALVQDDDDRIFNRATIRVCKIRDVGDVSGNMEFRINCNRERMDFSEILENPEIDGIDY